MKKLLSVTLALVMLLSVIPFSSASAKLSAERQEFVELWVRLARYNKIIYEGGHEISFTAIENAVDEINEIEEELPNFWFEYYYHLNNSENAEAIAYATEKFSAALDEVTEAVNSSDLTVVVDPYEFYMCLIKYFVFYSDEERSAIHINEKYADMRNEAEIGYEEAMSIIEREVSWENVTQEQFDAAVNKMLPFMNLMFDCLDGNHLYGEYVSNNDATEEADGTKTRVCDFCGAEDTVTDEGSRLGSEEKPLSFIEKLLAFFRNLFAKIFGIFG